ncbi:hypothetical protein [Pseudomonas lundensis]|uniref:hypothetical protein n=1 Tax=Pseudomonas lundensis TaxID=86185 RepID=UPI00089DA933|nr:hypothetical protein [Pseudomonas lundensis]
MRQQQHIDDRMAKPGLIFCRVDEPNKRSYRLWLTEAGREAAQQAMAEWVPLNIKLTQMLTDSELEVVSQWLRTVNKR